MRPVELSAKHEFDEREQGSVAVEFALVLPILVSLFLGVWQFGYAYYLYGELEQAVRDGGRYASLLSYDMADTPSYTSAVQNVVVYGDPAGGTEPVVPGLLSSNVSVTMSFSGSVPSTVSVSISGYRLPAMFGNLVLNGKPESRFPFLGDWAPL